MKKMLFSVFMLLQVATIAQDVTPAVSAKHKKMFPKAQENDWMEEGNGYTVMFYGWGSGKICHIR